MGLLDWWKKVTYVAPPEEQIKTALVSLFANAPYVKVKFNKVAQALPDNFFVIPGSWDGPALARTEINVDSITIKVDVSKVRRVMDCLEVVLGHEIFHASDAIDMGLQAYIDRVQSQADSGWWSKEVEQSTVKQEDELRALLIQKNFRIASSRTLQNRMHPL